jgi:hypothetical protein
VFDVKRLADDTGRFGRSRNSIEHFLGVSLGVLLVFDWRVAELVRLGSEQMGWKWLGDRHGGYLGTDLGTKYSAVSLVLSAINGPRDQNCATSHSRAERWFSVKVRTVVPARSIRAKDWRDPRCCCDDRDNILDSESHRGAQRRGGGFSN